LVQRSSSEMHTEDDIRHKEDGARDVVLIAREANVLVHAFDLGIAYVTSVDMAEQVENAHHTDEPKIDLPYEGLSSQRQFDILFL
jgi:hypothetical protein